MSGQTTFLGSPESRHKVSSPFQGSSPGLSSAVGLASPEALVPLSVRSQPCLAVAFAVAGILHCSFFLSSGEPRMQNTWFMGALGLTVRDSVPACHFLKSLCPIP